MVRVLICMALLLGGTAAAHAQMACTRSVLQAAADSYIAAQKAGDLSKMSLA